jgi:hypothetical protein
MKHIVIVNLEKTVFDEDDDGIEPASNDGESDEDDDDDEVETRHMAVCTMGPFETLQDAEEASERVIRAFTKAEREKITFFFDELEDEVGTILDLRSTLDTEELMRRAKAGELTPDELADYDDD